MYSEVVVQEVWQRRWEPWSWEAQWPAIGSWQLATESIIEADRSSYNYRRSCWRTQRRPFYGGLHLKQIGKVKKLNKWVPQELTKNKKKLAFLSVISFYSVQQWSDCDVLQNVNCIQLPTMTSSMAGLRRSSENGNTYSQHWSNRMGPLFPHNSCHTSHNQCFKSWRNWATKFCLIHHIRLTSCQLTTTSSSISTTFCRENANQQEAFQKFVESQNMDFSRYRNKQTYFS